MPYFPIDRIEFWLDGIQSWITKERKLLQDWKLTYSNKAKQGKVDVKFPCEINLAGRGSCLLETTFRVPFNNPCIEMDITAFGILTVNGRIAGGIDCNHQVVRINNKKGSTVKINIELFENSSYNDGMKTATLRKICMVKKDPEIEDLYFDLYVLYEASRSPQLTPEIRNYIEREVVLALTPLYDSPPDQDFWVKYVEKYPERTDLKGVTSAFAKGRYGTIRETPQMVRRKICAEISRNLSRVYSKINEKFKRPDGQMQFIGYSHLDLAWLWRIKETRHKIAVTMSSQVSLLREFPEWTFIVTSPQTWEYLKEDYPELHQEFLELVREDRIDAIETLWVEIEGQMPHPEGIIRQMSLGYKYSRNTTGKASGVVFLPDSFGYSRGLSTIIATGGSDLFFTAKLYNNDTSKVPHRDFNWMGQDGSSVRAHIFGVKGTAFNGTADLENILSSWNFYKSNGGDDTLLYTFGYGDGGGGPTYEMLKRISRYKKLKFLPLITTGNLGHFRKPKKTVLPVVKDDLYLCYNRGIYTSDSRIKRGVKLTEQRLIAAEIWKNWLLKDHSNGLEGSWKLVLKQHFHDIMAGTVIKEASDDVEADLKKVEKSINAIETGISAQYKSGGYGARGYLILSRSPLHSAAFRFSVKTDQIFDLRRGNTVLKGESYHDGLLHFVDDGIPAFGAAFYETVESLSDVTKRSTKEITDRPVKIPWRKGSVTISKSGITSIIQAGKQFLSEVARVRLYWHHPDRNDAWALAPEYPEHEIKEIKNTVKITHVSDNLSVSTTTRKYEHAEIIETVSIDGRLPYLVVDVTAKFEVRHIVARYQANLSFSVNSAFGDGLTGIIDQPISNTPFGFFDKFEWSAHRFADARGEEIGLALFNDSSYGYSVGDDKISTTLFTTPIYPNPFTETGSNRVRVGIMPHSHVKSTVDILGAASSFSIEPLVIALNQLGIKHTSEEPSAPVFGLPPNLRINGITNSDDGDIIMHISEVAGISGVTTMSPDMAFTSAEVVNFRTELKEADLSVRTVGERKEITVPYRSHQILAIKLTRTDQ